MLKTKLPIAITLIAVVSLLIAPAVYAAGTGTTTGSFGAASQAPTVSIGIFTDSSCLNSTTFMNPLTQYWCKVSVNSANKLKNLSQVQATLFYDSLSTDNQTAPTSGNTQTCAILTYTNSGPPNYTPSWSISPTGGNTTWLGGTGTAPSNLDATSGDFIFPFTPGKVATEAVGISGAWYWDAQGLATNKQSQTGQQYLRGETMYCYSEINVTGGVNWGSVPLGLLFGDATHNPQPGPSDNISITYIANGNYATDIESTDWTSGTDNVTLDETGGNPPGNPGYFALKASAVSDNSTWVTVTKSYTLMYNGGIQTPEAGTLCNTNQLWLSLSALGILPEVYSGTIYYQVQCR
jgi:hypothetical protein